MDLALNAAGFYVRTAARLSPRWGAAVAMPLFGHVARPRPIHDDDEQTMSRARRGTLRIAGVDRRGVDVETYEWGGGGRTVVLAHGWSGRASQFSMLVRDLVAEGYRVVAFDAPAHGASGGRRTYLVDWLDVFTLLQERYGSFDAIVGHSFGGLAALVGVAGGTDAARVVTIAAPADADLLLEQFQAMLRYPDAVSARMRDRFASRYFPGQSDPFAWLSSVRRPLAAGVPLLVVHDEGDRMVPFGEARRIASANPGAELLATTGLGHSRILTADLVLDAVLAHVQAPIAAAAPPVVDEFDAVSVAA
ncbi:MULTISPECIES: alpha/beta hydrolase [Microbacterium]|uniref:alpha/beta fold hydrolase n=1 Tax=Microbacterium TaxID=33882 RepID=UPI000D650771|nr:MULTISPECIES: alpha/beta hydrolase [Microbacterium]